MVLIGALIKERNWASGAQTSVGARVDVLRSCRLRVLGFPSFRVSFGVSCVGGLAGGAIQRTGSKHPRPLSTDKFMSSCSTLASRTAATVGVARLLNRVITCSKVVPWDELTDLES